MWRKVSDQLSHPASIALLGEGGVLAVGERTAVSRDEGRTWTPLDLPPLTWASKAHAIGPHGAFWSTDGWRTFQRTFDKPLDLLVEADGAAWATSRTAIYRFADGRWRPLSTGSRGRIGAIAVGHGALVISVGKQTVARSTDRGESWTEHTLAMPKNEWLTAIHVLEGELVGISNEHPKAFWRSVDGAHWERLRQPCPWHWTGVAAGDQLYLAGDGRMWVVEGERVEPVAMDAEIRVLAYGPDHSGDNALWAADRTSLYLR